MMWSEGQELPSLEKPAFTREQLHDYAATSLDKNPIHLEESFAKEAGFPSVIVHGMLSMAYLGDFICANFPAEAYQLKKLSTRFRKVTFPDDRLTCGGKVRKQEADGRLLVSLWAKNQKSEITADGEAELLPLK